MRVFYLKIIRFFEVKFSIYLNRRVFVMLTWIVNFEYIISYSDEYFCPHTVLLTWIVNFGYNISYSEEYFCPHTVLLTWIVNFGYIISYSEEYFCPHTVLLTSIVNFGYIISYSGFYINQKNRFSRLCVVISENFQIKAILLSCQKMGGSVIAKLKIDDNGTDVCHAKRGKTHTKKKKTKNRNGTIQSHIYRRVRNSQRRKKSSVLYNGCIRMSFHFFLRGSLFVVKRQEDEIQPPY